MCKQGIIIRNNIIQFILKSFDALWGAIFNKAENTMPWVSNLLFHDLTADRAKTTRPQRSKHWAAIQTLMYLVSFSEYISCLNSII